MCHVWETQMMCLRLFKKKRIIGDLMRTKNDDLVGGIPTPLKNMTSSVGIMTFHI